MADSATATAQVCSLAWAALAALVGLAACATSPQRVDVGHSRAGTPPTSEPAAVAIQRDCERCHQQIASQWHRSLHRRAFSNALFQSQLVHEPLPLCRSCHAPEARVEVRSVAERSPATDLGVACMSCHRGGSCQPTADHAPVRGASDFGPDGGCASCHQFAFPGEDGQSPLMMQQTAQEHRASPYAKTSCVACHMPMAAGGQRSHRFGVTRDAKRLRAAIVVEEAALTERGTARFRLRSAGVGHAFPTGDMMRRLALEVEVTTSEGNLRHVQYLTRRFQVRLRPHRPAKRVMLRDNRLPASGLPLVVETPALGEHILSARYTIHYQRVAEPARHGQPAQLDGSVLLVEGAIARP